MSDHVEDPAQAAVQRTLRTTLMAATVAAEQVARLRRHHQERAARQHRADAARMSNQYATHRTLALTELDTADHRWLDRADPQQVARVWETAHTWEHLEPNVFTPYAERLREHIDARYGIDVRHLPSSEEAQTADQLPAAAANNTRDRDHQQQRIATTDEAAATLVLGTAHHDRATDQAQRATEMHATAADPHDTANARTPTTGAGHDSIARRDALAARAEQAGIDPETIRGRVRASHAQGKPVRASSSRRQKRDGGTNPAPRAPSRLRDDPCCRLESCCGNSDFPAQQGPSRSTACLHRPQPELGRWIRAQ